MGLEIPITFNLVQTILNKTVILNLQLELDIFDFIGILHFPIFLNFNKMMVRLKIFKQVYI
jgi:hypothetical protein